MQSGDQALAEEAFDSALKAPEVPQARKLEMLQRKYEFFEEMTFDVMKAQAALEEYTKMLKVCLEAVHTILKEQTKDIHILWLGPLYFDRLPITYEEANFAQLFYDVW